MLSTSAPPSLITGLPIELVCCVLQLLDIEDVFRLAMSCRYFHDIIQDNSICRPLIEKQAPFSDECVRMRRTWDYAKALRALVKRQLAISNLQPFAVAVVAETDVPTHGISRNSNGSSDPVGHGNNGYTRDYAPPPPAYVYANKTLLYMVGRTLRILDLHDGTIARRETAVDVRRLLDEAVPQSKGTCNYVFRPLHYAEGIVSCVYAHHRLTEGAQESWLVLFNTETRLQKNRRLALPYHRLFVRNNKDYLVFGTYTRRRLSEQDTDVAGLGGGEGVNDNDAYRPRRNRYRRWVLWHYNIRDDEWSKKAISLDKSIGLADLGSSLCFEVMDGYFYALANQQRFVEEDDYDLDEDVGNGDVQEPSSFLDFNDVHNFTGPQHIRTATFTLASYYTCERFHLSNPYHHETPMRASTLRRLNDEGPLDDRWTTLQLIKNAATGQSMVVESRKEWLRVSGGSSSRRTYYMQPLEWAPAKSEEASAALAPKRRPEHVHPGDDSSRTMPLTLSKCGARVYSPSSQTFLDLFYQNDYVLVDNMLEPPKLGLRAGARRDRPPTLLGQDDADAAADGADDGDSPLYPMREINRRYVNRDVVTWPSAGSDDGRDGSEELDQTLDEELSHVLNPPGYCGNVIGTSWDDRLLLYATSSSDTGAVYPAQDARQAIVLVSFDPTLCLPGLEVWDDCKRAGRRGQSTAKEGLGGKENARSVGLEDARTRGSQETTSHDDSWALGQEMHQGAHASWVSYEEPMYRGLGRGFDFSYHIQRCEQEQTSCP